MNPRAKTFRKAAVQGLLLTWLAGGLAASELLPPGFRPLPLGVHALTGGKVVVRPGEVIEAGTIIIRDGFIGAVGKNLSIPPDARVWPMQGATIYAGFLEPYLVLKATNAPVSTSDVLPISSRGLTSGAFNFFGAPNARTDSGSPGPGYGIPGITPEYRAILHYSPDEKTLRSLRELGFTAALTGPSKGILRGTSALVTLADQDPNRVVLKPDVFQHVAFETSRGESGAYPDSLMGVIASIRQTFLDAQHYVIEWAAPAARPQGRPRPDFNPALEALVPAASGKMPVLIEPGSALMDDRAGQISRELGLHNYIVASGQEWRRPDLMNSSAAGFIVPVNFPSLPKMPAESDWDQVTLDQLRSWDWAAENPALLRRSGVSIALTTYGLIDRKDFRKNLRLALDRGLTEDDALAALTTIPAKWLGAENQLGTIEPGKLANLTVVRRGSYFDPESRVSAVWIDGRIYPAPPEAKSGKGMEEAAEHSPQPPAANPPKEEPEKHPVQPGAAEPAAPNAGTNGVPEVAAKDAKSAKAMRDLMKQRVAHSPLEGRGPLPLAWPPNARRDQLTNTPPAAVLFRNATLWLCDEKGTVVTNGSVLVRNGKIAAAGQVSTPADAVLIDAAGWHITPGIIDAHSHTAILGNVNEAGLPSTAMVRISDVINSETDNLYEQLAGGVTAVNLLHGSANPIGGQSCLIKLRDGASPEGLIFSNAPAGIKFALGENVKQSNWGEKFNTRFPQTRMGVRTFFQNRFVAARQYLRDWEDYSNAVARASGRAGKPETETAVPLPPRRDLELETIGEILRGQRWIHCHAYRQDEMLMLLRLMQNFGVQIGSFEHALEGYKIADELAAAGVGASTFSDWWAYKFEVYDAIPYNGSLLRERGVLVSFNSDSSELARRLYQEAAKAVKYGGTSPAEALKFITLNPARQLRIDLYVGSLEPGKDADLAIWSKSPLDSGTVCLQTWVEGRKYFDRSLNAARVGRLQQERQALLSKATKMQKLSAGDDATTETENNGFFRTPLEHEFDAVDRHCLDEE